MKYEKEIQEYNDFYTERMERLGRMASPSLAYNSYHFYSYIYNNIVSLHLEKSSRIGDIGCGNGQHLVIIDNLTQNKYTFLGIDLSDEAMRMANTYVHKRKLKNIKYISGAFEDMKIKNSFSAVF